MKTNQLSLEFFPRSTKLDQQIRESGNFRYSGKGQESRRKKIDESCELERNGKLDRKMQSKEPGQKYLEDTRKVRRDEQGYYHNIGCDDGHVQNKQNGIKSSINERSCHKLSASIASLKVSNFDEEERKKANTYKRQPREISGNDGVIISKENSTSLHPCLQEQQSLSCHFKAKDANPKHCSSQVNNYSRKICRYASKHSLFPNQFGLKWSSDAIDASQYLSIPIPDSIKSKQFSRNVLPDINRMNCREFLVVRNTTTGLEIDERVLKVFRRKSCLARMAGSQSQLQRFAQLHFNGNRTECWVESQRNLQRIL